MADVGRRRAIQWACATVGLALGPAAGWATPPDSAYRLVFADEFLGNSLDTSKWASASPSWTMPNSLSTASSNQVGVGGGVLTLNATRNGANTWSSGSVSTYNKYNFAGGYVESRIKLPSTPGSWPAFWGLYNGWPPEADIMEYPLTTGSGGLANNQYNTNFHYSTGSGNAAGAGVVNPGSDLRNTWHTFAMDWTSGTSVTFYFDGVAKTSYSSSNVAQMANMYMILDYAVGGWPGTPSTSQWAPGASDQTQVDWVRVWQKNAAGDITSNWKTAGGGAFATSTNWVSGVPKYGNMVAGFGTVGASTAAISMNAWQVFGGMTFNGTTAYTVGTPANAVQLASTTGAVVQATSASTVDQIINAKLELWNDSTFQNDMTGHTLNVNGSVYGAGLLTVVGTGTVVLAGDNGYTAGTSVGGGTLATATGVVRAGSDTAFGTGTVTVGGYGNSTTSRLEVNGGRTIANNINLGGRANSTVGIEHLAGNDTLSGTIAAIAGGSAYTIQSDAGLLTLSGSGSVAAGVALQASASGSRTFTLQGSGDGLVSGKIQNGSGTLSIIKAGTGTWTLGGANTYTGATAVTGGRLILSHAGAPSSLSVSGGATLSTRGAITTSGSLNSSGTLDLIDLAIANVSAASLNLTSSTLNLQLGTGTASDRIVSSGAATVSGTNTINLSAVPGQSITSGMTYTLITASGGLSAANFAIGTKPASLAFTSFSLSTPTAGALLATATGNPTPNTAYWNGAGSTATNDAANNWAAGSGVGTSNWSTDVAGTSNAVQVPGSITNVVFNAANAAAGGTFSTQLDSAYAVNALTFDVGNAAVTSAVLNTNGNVLSVGNGVTLAATSVSPATIGGTGTLLAVGSQSWGNNNGTRALTVNVPTSAGAAGLTTLTLNGSGAGGVALNGVVADGAGTLAVTFDQAGVTTVSAVNTYTGLTTVNSGTVDLTGRVAGDVAVKNGGTLRLDGGADNVADTAGVDVQAGGTLDVRAAPGAAKIEWLARLTGGGTVTRGTAGQSTLTVGGTGQSGTFSGAIANGVGNIALVKSGAGTLTLAGPSTFSGGTTINAGGGALLVTHGNALGTGPLTIGQGGANETGGLQLSGDVALVGVPTINLSTRNLSSVDGVAQIENVSGNNSISANLNINNTGGSSANVLSSSGTLTLSGTLSSTGLTSARGFDFYGNGNGVVSGLISNGTVQPTFVQKDDTGTWTLSNNNTYTGGTTVNGGVFNLTGNNNFGSGAITVNDGVAVLSGSNTYTGGTIITGTSVGDGGSTVTGGRVVMANVNALGPAGANVTLSGNATLEVATDGGDRAYTLNVGTTNIVNLVSGVTTGSAGINHTLGNLFIGNSDTVNVTAAANVTVGGPSITLGTVTLSSGFGTGSTTFNPTTAALKLGAISTSTGGAKTLILDGTAAGNAVYGAISNGTSAVSVLKSNGSTWTLAAAGTYTGGTIIADNGGTLAITNGAALGTGSLTIGQGGSNPSGELQLAGNISLTGVPTINVSTRLLSTAGGAATIENVSGNNAIAANFNINGTGGNAVNVLSTAGKLTLTGSLSSTGLSSARGYNFYGSGDGAVTGAITNGTAQPTFVQKAGAGTWTLSGNNTYTGGTTVAGGTLAVASSTAFGVGTVTNNANVGFVSALALTVTNPITGSGSVAQSGTGVTTLSAANTYTGTTAVSAGTLRLTPPAYTVPLTNAGGIDLGNNGGILVLDYTSSASPLGAVQSALAAASANGFATGQIRSSTLAGGRTIGYGTDGTSVVTVRVTLPGDADLDGDVDFNDFLALQNSYGQTGTRFDQGNFDYDNVTDFNDFLALQNSYGQTAGFDVTPVVVTAAQVAALKAFAAANAPVPEPAAIGLIGGVGLLLGRRRRTFASAA